ncbi:MAG: glycosyltransferase family 2 protein [Candidatus Bathyarchaeota archaeon]|nr:glycosyltransferase family 2 protein [Candidatus Bathyarchaeota archaeon]
MEKSSKKPRVSIIIPTYNSGGTLAECLRGICDQSYPFYEVVVVDNFSNDDTVRIAEEFGVKIIQQKCNPALARNFGIVNSTGKYILFLDSDQVLHMLVIEECVKKCETEKVGMVRIPEVFIGRGFWSFCSAAWKNCYFKVEKLYGASENLITGEPRFFVKEQITRVGMLDADLLWGEDYDLYSRLKKVNIKETSCKSKLYHYEPTSIKNMLIKNLRYGKSMPIFLQQTKKQVFPLMLRHALLTFREVFRNFKKSPAIIAGCAVLLYLKTCSIMIGLLIDLTSSRYKG